MLDFLWIIPNLNEKYEIITENINKIEKYAKKIDKPYKIVIADGGSNHLLLQKIRLLCDEHIKLFMVLPTSRPTKDKGIKDIINSFNSKYVIIIDSDCANLDNKTLRELTIPLLNKKALISLPYVTKTGGRINRLVCKPLLKLLFPKVSKRIKFPLTGLVSINYAMLNDIVNKKDFLWDWGGEIQIIIHAALKTRKIHQFLFNKKDSKKRSLNSKKDDARQVMTAILYEAVKNRRINYLHQPKKQNSHLDTSYEDYLIKEMVIKIFDNLFLSKKKDNKKGINKPENKIDKLKLASVSDKVINIYKQKINYVNNMNLIKSFIQIVHKKIVVQEKMARFASINLSIINPHEIMLLSKIYNSKLDDLTKSRNITKAYDAWKVR
jgi:hypothetical protein